MRADWYDFPGWYDILHAPGTAREVSGLERIERRFGTAPGRRVWFEPACGTGRYLRVAAGRGIRVIGLDRGERMIEYTRDTFARRRLRGEFLIGDMTCFRLRERCTFAFCTINTIRHLASDRDMLAHLSCVRRALAPGGVYAVGIETSRYGLDFPSEDVWKGRRGSAQVVQAVQYLPPKRGARREHVISHLTITTPLRDEHLTSTYDLRSYSEGEWAALLKRARWRVLGVCDADGRNALRTARGSVVGGYGIYVLSPSDHGD